MLKCLRLLQITAVKDIVSGGAGQRRRRAIITPAMAKDVRDEGPRVGPHESRSELLRSQLRRWTDQLAAAGKAAELFELEMWLRSFERFFRIGGQPLSDREMRTLALRNWSEELRLVDNALMRVVHLATSILSEEHVDLTRFDRYVEASFARDEGLDPYIEKLVRHATPEAALTLLRESFEDLHLLLVDLVRLSRLPYATFHAVGKILYREVRRSDLVAMIIDKKFKPVHDRVRSRRISRLIRGVEDPTERRQAAKVFLELFRLLHYLEYTDPARLPEGQLRDTILPFALITSETRLLLGYIEKKVLKGREIVRPLDQVYDSFVYCMPLELRKVMNTELSRHLRDPPGRQRAHARREQPRDPEGLLPAVDRAAGAGLRPGGGRRAHLPGLHRPARPVAAGCATGWRRSSARCAPSRPTRTRRRAARDEGPHLRLLRPLHQVPDVPRLVGVRAVLHRDPEVRQHDGRSRRSRTASRPSWSPCCARCRSARFLQGVAAGGRGPGPARTLRLPLPDRATVRTLLLDAGGVLVRPSFARVAEALRARGVSRRRGTARRRRGARQEGARPAAVAGPRDRRGARLAPLQPGPRARRDRALAGDRGGAPGPEGAGTTGTTSGRTCSPACARASCASAARGCGWRSSRTRTARSGSVPARSACSVRSTRSSTPRSRASRSRIRGCSGWP